MSDKKKAIWWFSPSLLEPCDGPWGRMIEFGHDPILAWKAIIDWAAKLNVDRLITGIEPYSSDRVYNQWGFHYICHFPDDPAACCFDKDTIERNIKIVRAVCAYGCEKNVRILFHHYNLMAPERWVRAHPGLLKKYNAINDPVWGHNFRNDRMGYLVSNVCWSDPEYKTFLKRCWQEAFNNIPELAGAMITAGEFNYCGCDECTGGTSAHIFQSQDDQENAAAIAAVNKLRSEKRGEMCIDLIKTFTGAMDELNKESIVRTWVMSSWMNRLPKGVNYATKYSVFDACWGGVDPVVHNWLAAGHRMWETVAIEAENCGPVIWHDENWSKVTGQINNELDTEGCIIHINIQWGHIGHIASFTASRNITRMLEALSPSVKNESSLNEFRQFFGPKAGIQIHHAAQLIAAFPLHMTSIVHLAREGFSYGMPPWFDGNWRWPGVLGSPRYQPEEWSNPDALTNIYELIQIVIDKPESYHKFINAPEGSAISRCDEIAEWCKEACTILKNCPEPHSAQAKSELRALTAGAYIAAHAASEHAAVLRARIAWEAVKHSAVAMSDANAARTVAVKWYKQAVDELSKQIPWGLELARIYPDVINHVTESHETFNRLTMATRLRIRLAELHLIQTVKGPDWMGEMTINFWEHLPNSIGSNAQS